VVHVQVIWYGIRSDVGLVMPYVCMGNRGMRLSSVGNKHGRPRSHQVDVRPLASVCALGNRCTARVLDQYPLKEMEQCEPVLAGEQLMGRSHGTRHSTCHGYWLNLGISDCLQRGEDVSDKQKTASRSPPIDTVTRPATTTKQMTACVVIRTR
jgi:hypothetical protein